MASGPGLLEPPFEVPDFPADDEATHGSAKVAVEDATSTKVEASAVDGKDFMCTILCDMLFCLPTEWTEKSEVRSLKVIKALESCYENDCYEAKKGTCYYDLRGRYAHQVKDKLISAIAGWPCPPRFLNVIVGCKVHGVGEGILKKAVIGLLKHDKNIKWKKKWGGSVISINLGRKNCPLLGEIDGTSRISMFPCGGDDDNDDHDDDHNDVDEDDPTESNLNCRKVSAADLDKMEAELEAALGASMIKGGWGEIGQYKGRPLCLIATDLLCCLRRPENLYWDKNMSERVLAGFGKCYKSDSDKCREGKNKVDLRGWFVEDAIEKLIEHLNLFSCLTPFGLVEVIVGCMEHGVGEGKLKQAIIGLLNSDETIKIDEKESDVIIRIKLDGPKDYNYLRTVRCEGFLSESDDDDSDSLSCGCGAMEEYLALKASNSGFARPSFMEFVVDDGILLSKAQESRKVECTSVNTIQEDDENFLCNVSCDLVLGERTASSLDGD